ncbi:MAG: AAA family ATPase [Methanocalculus sp.]|uniref:AAA family ATPase n=1 Tax=Methanocalculus sp. TaxID=2004547 RepID=UPI00271CBF24|nr:AAA family ATPase [Methanocalculus sp.]MDO9539088.1 AAA family ATPase [Methanocalculus sp.]
MTYIPHFTVIVGANGTGKSTLFSVFGFLKNALSGNVNSALQKPGGSRGFFEVRNQYQKIGGSRAIGPHLAVDGSKQLP